MPGFGSDDETVTGFPRVLVMGSPLPPDLDTCLLEVVVDLDSVRPSMFVLRFQPLEFTDYANPVSSFPVGAEVSIGEAGSGKTLITAEVTSIEADYGAAGQE